MINTQEEALELIESGKNVFLGGVGGAGKSYLLDQYYQANKNKRRIAITASTGIAARNIDGQTYHQYTGVGLGPKMVRDYNGEMGYETISEFIDRLTAAQWFQENKESRLKELDVLAIDEVSMVHGFMLDVLDRLFRTVKDKFDEPFGGLQVILTGDFLQLPCVMKRFPGMRKAPPTDWCFKSKAWEALNLEYIWLREIHRQSDLEFITALNEIRYGIVSDTTNKLMRSRVRKASKQEIYENPDWVLLHTHNNKVDEINAECLSNIPVAGKTYYAETFGSSKDVEYLVKNNITPEALSLKTGAKIIATVNNHEQGFFNGSLGVVGDLPPTNSPIPIDFNHCGLVNVSKATWSNQHYEPNENNKATMTQYPLRLAFCLSVHKSQGLSLPKIYFDPSCVFLPGQTYVALSRATSLEGLFLKDWKGSYVYADREVLEFCKANQLY